MKPQLVEYDKIFQKKVKIKEPQLKKSKEIIYQIDNSSKIKTPVFLQN